MVKVKDMEPIRINGKLRLQSLWKCTKCGGEKQGRSDMKQTTEYCRACSNTTHGKEGTKVYNCWLQMKARCYNKNNPRYHSHGGRGITVCREWLDSSSCFITWAEANGFKAEEGSRNTEYTIDRKDNDGNYEPSNCRVVSLNIQQWNKQVLMNNNTSGYRGVSRTLNRYAAHITYEGKNVFYKRFNTALEAAIARELYIINKNLPHIRNWSDLTAIPKNSTIDQIKEIIYAS